MDAGKIVICAVLAVAECYLAYQIYRVIYAVRRARTNMAQAKSSTDHPAKVRLFVDAQTKMTKMDMQMGAMFGIGFVVIAFLLAHLST